MFFWKHVLKTLFLCFLFFVLHVAYSLLMASLSPFHGYNSLVMSMLIINRTGFCTKAQELHRGLYTGILVQKSIFVKMSKASVPYFFMCSFRNFSPFLNHVMQTNGHYNHTLGNILRQYSVLLLTYMFYQSFRFSFEMGYLFWCKLKFSTDDSIWYVD